MSQIDSFLDGNSSTSDIDSFLNTEPSKPAGAIRKLADAGLSVAKGVIGVPEAAVGLADLVTKGHAGKLAESAGIRFKDAKDVLTGWQSDDLKGKQKQFQEADGILSKTGVALSNPSLVANAVAESVPLMGAGGVGARALMAAAPKLGAVTAGALGEGLAGAGAFGEATRQETSDGLLTGKQAALAAASGGATALFGAAGGKLAQKLGIGDIDTMIARGTTQIASGAQKGIIRRMAEGAVSEGVLEELPQSLSEQGLQNVALDRPVTQGMEDAGVMGLLAGGVMGAGAGAISRQAEQPAPPPATPPTSPTEPALQIGNTPEPMLQFRDGTVARKSDFDAYVNSLPPEQQPAALAKVMGLAPQPAKPTFANVLDTDNVYANWSNVRDGSDRATMRDEIDFVAKTYGPLVTPENRETIKQDLSQQFKWFRAAPTGQKDAALDAMMTQATPVKPSAAMGLNPAAGPMQAAATVAVDTGVHEGIQQQGAAEADQASYDKYFNEQAQQAQQQDTIDKPLTTGPIAEAAMSEDDKRAVLFSNQTVGDGGIKFKGTQDGDILNGMAAPYSTYPAAARRANMEGKDWQPVKIGEKQFVARRKDANGPTNPTESTAATGAPVQPTDTAGAVGAGPGAGIQPAADTVRANADGVVQATGLSGGAADAAVASASNVAAGYQGAPGSNQGGQGAVRTSPETTGALQGTKSPGAPTQGQANQPVQVAPPKTVEAAQSQGNVGQSSLANNTPEGQNVQNPQAPALAAPVKAPGAPTQAVAGNAATATGIPAAGSATVEGAGLTPTKQKAAESSTVTIKNRITGGTVTGKFLPEFSDIQEIGKNDAIKYWDAQQLNWSVGKTAQIPSGPGQDTSVTNTQWKLGFHQELNRLSETHRGSDPAGMGTKPNTPTDAPSGVTSAPPNNTPTASVGGNIATPSPSWDTLTPDAKTAVLKRAGWVTKAGDLNIVGKNLLKKPWADITEGTQATIQKNSQPKESPNEKAPEAVQVSPQQQAPAAAGVAKPETFKTKLLATVHKNKFQPNGRVIKVGDRFAVVDRTEAQLANDALAAKRRLKAARAAAYDRNPLMTFLATHGLFHAKDAPRSQKKEFSPDSNIMVSGYGPVFKSTGKQPSDLVVYAIEEGYLPQDGTAKQMEEFIRRAISGEKISPMYAEGVAEQIAQARMDEQPQFDDFLEADIDPFGDLDYSPDDFDVPGYSALEDPIKAEVAALLAQAETLGIDTEQIRLDASYATANESEQAYYEAARDALQAAIAASNRDSSANNGEAGNAGIQDGLTAPTQAEVLAQQERAEAAERAEKAQKKADDALAKKEQERKDIADRSIGAADTFELGQDPLQSLTGQGSVFDAPAQPAAPVSSVQGQKNLASRGSRIATLKMMNEQIRKLDPTEAWHDSNIEDTADLDALQDRISQTLVDLQRAQPATEPAFTYINGDRAEYTGKTETISGGLFHEVKFTEGAKKGKTAVTQRAPDGTGMPDNAPKTTGIVTPQIVPAKPAAPDTKRQIIELRKRESVLKSLRACLGA